MTTQRHYRQAPITEAIIDIRARLSESIGIDDLEQLHDLFRDRYPRKSKRNLAQGRFEVGKQVAASAKQQPIGYLFTTPDEKQVFQARLDGCTLSRLAPYENWQPFRDEAKRLWDIYRDAVKPQKVERLAVRYINRIDIPFPFEDLKQYLRTFPEVSCDIPQALTGLFMQLTIPQPDIECVALINEALVEPSKPDAASIVLDIDLFRPNNLPQDDAGIWDFFEVLRERKNELFEACITDSARGLFR